MKKMRTWLLVLVPVLLLGWGVYALIFEWIVPQSATLVLPRKWKRIPFREPRSTAHGYFGTPVRIAGNMDEWGSGIDRKQYLLRVYYASADSLVVSYSIHYKYKSWLVSKDYVMDTASVQ
jgi:hypothetical protein